MFKGRLFHTDKNIDIFGTYSTQQDVVYATPDGAEHMVHVKWTNLATGKKGSIDYFKILDLDKIDPGEKTFLKLSGIDKEYERKTLAEYQIIERFKDAGDLLRNITVEDIRAFIGFDKHRKNLVESEPKIDYVKEVMPYPLKVSGEAKVVASGKQDFSPNRVCVFRLNLDFADYCIAGTTPEGKLAPWNECLYCYADYTHKGYPNVRNVDKKNLVEQMTKLKTEIMKEDSRQLVMRLGKRTDCGASIFRENLNKTLEACLECKIPVVITSKFLEFRKETAELLKKTNSTYMISFGNDELEAGAVSFGRTQTARMESGLKYLEAGVRAVPYILRDVTLEDGGQYFRENVKKLPNIFPQVQFLGLRLRHEAKSNKIYGGWHSMVKQGGQGLWGQDDGRFVKGPDGTLVPPGIHSFLEKVIGNNNENVRMCSHDKCNWQCGKCFISDEEGIIINDWKKYLPVLKKTPKKPIKMADPATFKLVSR